jgi:hypothetical protein
MKRWVETLTRRALRGARSSMNSNTRRESKHVLESVKISRRQSEIRQALASLVGKEAPSDDETRNMETIDKEYHQDETRYRAALIAEDTERRDAKRDLETRGGNEWAELIGKFELR